MINPPPEPAQPIIPAGKHDGTRKEEAHANHASPSEARVGRRVLVNTGALAGSSLWRILISFVLQVFIARQLDIPGVGIYNAALAYLNVGQVLSEIGLPSLLVRNLAQHPNQRRALFLMSLRLQLLMAAVVWTGLAAFALLLEPPSRTALWIVGASLPFYAITSTTQTLFQAAERMEFIMGVEWLINALILGGSLAVLLTGGGILALVSVLVVAQALSALVCLALLRYSRLLGGEQVAVATTYGSLWGQVTPFFRLSIADVLLQRLDILLLTVLGGEVITGIYSLAYNLVRVLTKLVQSFWQALYPTFSRLFVYDSRKYMTLTGLSFRYGLVALVPAVVLSAAVAPDLLPFIFSAGFTDSAPVYRILVWLGPLLFISTYISTLLMVQRLPRLSLMIAIAHLGALVLLLPLLTYFAQAQGAAWAAVAAGCIGCLAGVMLARRHAIPLSLERPWALILAGAVGALAALYMPVAWPLRVLVGGLLYLVLAWRLSLIVPEDIQGFRRAWTGQRQTSA